MTPATTNDQLLLAYDQLLTDLEQIRDALRQSIGLVDELLPLARRYGTPRELAELGVRAVHLEEQRAVLVRSLA